MLSQLDIIDTLKSQALIDLEISHEEYKTIINEEKNYGNLKEIIRKMESDTEKDELNKKEDKKKKKKKKMNAITISEIIKMRGINFFYMRKSD